MKLPIPLTATQFEQLVGRAPQQDDLQRVNCQHASEVGHHYCGWCDVCGPMFQCICNHAMTANTTTSKG